LQKAETNGAPFFKIKDGEKAFCGAKRREIGLDVAPLTARISAGGERAIWRKKFIGAA
jgi:hypothetical protein